MSVRLGEVPAVDHRDAIHLAVIPMTASEMLRPGQRVGVQGGEAAPGGDIVGIVDPFLADVVPAGGRFWLCLLPDTVTGMRHHWAHPVFDAPETGTTYAAGESEEWLRRYAQAMNRYDDEEEAFERLVRGLKTGELFARGTDLHGLYDVGDADELRKHAEAYLGIEICWDTFTFTCSC